RRLEFVADEFEHRGAREIGDREHRAEHRLEALIETAALRLVPPQKLVVGRPLNLKEVWPFPAFPYFSEELANAFATGECLLRHRGLSLSSPFLGANLPKRGCSRPPGLNFLRFSGRKRNFRDSSPEFVLQTFKTQNDARGA